MNDDDKRRDEQARRIADPIPVGGLAWKFDRLPEWVQIVLGFVAIAVWIFAMLYA